eukprot:8103209-Alexandrium_andersonii.AAC.1
MSASLVGSEMCIRDRGDEGGGVRAAGSGPSGGRRGRRFAGGGRAARAVSYTHLTLPTICSV